jgi:5,10-methylenetetrahydromethanopterin reductase
MTAGFGENHRHERRNLLGGVGVVCRLIRPSIADLVEQARTAEEAGADWMVLPDALGWHDVWMSLAAAGTATSRIRLGPAVTNPYTRHPLVTLAALATMHEIIGSRVLLGVGAGGSELAMYTDIDRSDAPQRVRALVDLVRATARGDLPLPMSARVPDAPLLGGARKRRMVETVADCCDVVLLSGQARDDVIMTAQIAAGHGTAVAWSPMLAGDGPHLRAGIVYGLLNSPLRTRRGLGVDASLEAELRARLTAGGATAAASLVPDKAVEAFVTEEDLGAARSFARDLGAFAIAVQAFDVQHLPERIQWARRVLTEVVGGP